MASSQKDAQTSNKISSEDRLALEAFVEEEGLKLSLGG